MAVSLPQGAVKELRPNEGEHKKDRERHQHQHNAEGDYAFFSSFTSDVPRHEQLEHTRQRQRRSPTQGREGGLNLYSFCQRIGGVVLFP